jgi:hypothetical protein
LTSHKAWENRNEKGHQSMPFLDILVNIDNEQHEVYTQVYRKPTNPYQLMPTLSYHAKKTSSNTISAEIRRLRVLSTYDTDFISGVMEHKQRLINRAHREEELAPLFDNLEMLPSQRELLARPKVAKVRLQRKFFITYRTPASLSLNLTKVLMPSQRLLDTYFLGQKPQVIFKRTKNLAEILKKKE